MFGLAKTDHHLTQLQSAIDRAVEVARRVRRDDRRAVRKKLDDGIEELKRIELFADDAEKPVRRDGVNVFAQERISVGGRLNPLVRLIRGR